MALNNDEEKDKTSEQLEGTKEETSLPENNEESKVEEVSNEEEPKEESEQTNNENVEVLDIPSSESNEENKEITSKDGSEESITKEESLDSKEPTKEEETSNFIDVKEESVKQEVKEESTIDETEKREVSAKSSKKKKNNTVEESEREKASKKLKEEIKKSQEKKEGKSRLLEYIKTEHKWENYVMIAVGIAALLVGVLILVGTLTPRSDFWLIGDYPKVVAWVLVAGGAVLILYGLWPIYKPSFPELKKITWLTGKKYWADVIRVFLFLIIFALLFLLYDTFIQEVLARIMGD